MFSSVSLSESDTGCSDVLFKDVEKREVSEREVQMDGDKPVWMIQDALCEKEPELEYEAMFFYNQAEEVDDHQATVKVFKSGDVVTVFMGEIAPPEQQDKGRKRCRSIANYSGMDVRLGIVSKWLRRKMYFSDTLHSIDFDKWSRSIEVYWYSLSLFNLS